MSYPIFVKRDLDGFFGLFIDNIVQLLLIVQLCTLLCGMSGEDSRFVTTYILPGAAVSILMGNLFYAVQAHVLARRQGRSDVTALPYGINTPSLLVFIFFVMAPTYRESGSALMAWQMGLLACLGSGLIELGGSFVAGWIRRHTPRAALLATLAGIAITFISMTFALQIWQRPLVAMLPLAVVMITYFAHARFPLGLPGGLVGVALGTVCAWALTWGGSWLPEGLRLAPDLDQVHMSVDGVRQAWAGRGAFWPQWCWPQLQELLADQQHWVRLVSVVLPMGLFNVAGSLQNIESAEAGGDRYHTGTSLAANGIGTILAACFGSCFPTTIYIGHPGWKKLGARAGYSTLNGLVISAVCLTGTVSLLNSIVPIEAGIAIVLWIGIVITAQAYQATPSDHAPAVALGLFPAIAAWGATLVAGALQTAAGGATTHDVPTLQSLLTSAGGLNTEVNGFLIHGMILLERGYIFTCMIVAAIGAALIDRKFYTAAIWSIIAGLCTALGLMHAYQVRGNEIDHWFWLTATREGAWGFRATFLALSYGLMAMLFWGFARFCFRDDTPPPAAVDDGAAPDPAVPFRPRPRPGPPPVPPPVPLPASAVGPPPDDDSRSVDQLVLGDPDQPRK